MIKSFQESLTVWPYNIRKGKKAFHDLHLEDQGVFSAGALETPAVLHRQIPPGKLTKSLKI